MFRRVSPGQRLNQFPAAAANGLFDIIEGRNHRETKGNGTGRTGDPIEIFIKNKTGSALSSFAVVAVGDVVLTKSASEAAFYREHLFEGNTPTASSPVIAVVQEPLAVDGIGRAVVQGVTAVTLTVTSSGDSHAGPTTSTSELTTGASGIAQILWKESGTGSGRWGKILLNNVAPAATPTLEYENFYLTSDFTYSSVDTWEKVYFPGGSGVITFPSTGIWQVEVNAHISVVGWITSSTSGLAGAAWMRLSEVSGDSVLLSPDNPAAEAFLNCVVYDNPYLKTGTGGRSIPILLQVDTANVEALEIEVNTKTLGTGSVVSSTLFADYTWIRAIKLSD